jgi:putative oxidoreductase
MLESIFAPYRDWAPLVLRVALAIIFFVHGWPKINPNSPMKGIPGVTASFKQSGIPLPGLSAVVVALLETAGAALLLLGLGTRILAALLAFEMLVATWAKIRVWKVGFSARQTTGWELDFLLFAGAIALLILGPGSIAIGR